MSEKLKCYEYTIRSISDGKIYCGFVKGINKEDARRNAMLANQNINVEDLQVYDSGMSWKSYLHNNDRSVGWR